MPDKERGEEEERLKVYKAKFEGGLQKMKELRNKFDIK